MRVAQKTGVFMQKLDIFVSLGRTIKFIKESNNVNIIIIVKEDK